MIYRLLAFSLLTVVLTSSCAQAPRPLVRSQVIQFHPRPVNAPVAPVVVPPPLAHHVPVVIPPICSRREIVALILGGILTVGGALILWQMKVSND